MSTPARQMSWQDDAAGVTVPLALAPKRETIRDVLVEVRTQHRNPDTGRVLSQEDAARRVGRGITGRTWQRWEAMEVTPRRPNLEAVAETFGFPVERFYDDEPATVAELDVLALLRQLRDQQDQLAEALAVVGEDVAAVRAAVEPPRKRRAS